MIHIKYKKTCFPKNVISFPDGTLKIDVPEIPVTDNSPIEIEYRDSVGVDLTLLIYITENLKERYSNPINLYMPYLPNARMDRVHEKIEVFTLKYFCKIINFLEFNIVKILDVHSPVGSALLDRCENLSPEKYIKSAVELSGIDRENDYIFFADEGSCKRYSDMFKDFRNIGFGIKKRDWKTGKILGLDIHGESPENKNVLIIDDICSFGGTVYYSAKKLKELNCGKIYAYFTHCEESIKRGVLLSEDLLEHIYTTNSLFDVEPDSKMTVFDCYD
ncbi:MAG: ribose-phosphate pyrophosphokinase [Ruminococcus flavefaciens]|nr:ribose-phosphate pyrophosphokinase [Ruminococcus flavefaciens]